MIELAFSCVLKVKLNTL